MHFSNKTKFNPKLWYCLSAKKNPAQQNVTRDGICNHSGALLRRSGSSSRPTLGQTARSLFNYTYNGVTALSTLLYSS